MHQALVHNTSMILLFLTKQNLDKLMHRGFAHKSFMNWRPHPNHDKQNLHHNVVHKYVMSKPNHDSFMR